MQYDEKEVRRIIRERYDRFQDIVNEDDIIIIRGAFGHRNTKLEKEIRVLFKILSDAYRDDLLEYFDQ